METYSVLGESKRVGRLAGPLIVSQVSQVGMGFTDTVMAGRLGASDLAAIAIGSSLWIPIYLGCIGVMMAVAPTVAHHKGANQSAKIASVYRQSLWIALGLAMLSVPLTRSIGIIMPWLDIDATIIPITQGYLQAIAWGMPAFCVYLALRFVSEGIGHTRPIMYIQLVALLANAVGNYILMFGKLGAPAMGAVGAGWSSAIVLCLDAVLMFLYARFQPRYHALNLFGTLARPHMEEIGELLRLGTPIALTITMEVGLFTAVSLLMGSLGITAVAAHQIALNYTALTFMVPLGISMAITIRVGHAMGARDATAARLSGIVGMGMAVASMLLSAIVILLIPEKIVLLYTTETTVAKLAVSLLHVAALFQVSDGLQVSAVGALRGLKDTRVPMLITFFAYWIVGLPLAYLLGINHALGPQGLWIGLIFGLTVAALLLSLRFHMITRRLIATETRSTYAD